jgi:transcriptional regulator with XRE-family HTH domain
MKRRGQTWEMTAAEPRPCVRCLLVKPGMKFPPSAYGGVRRVCWACIEGEAWQMLAMGYRPRNPADWRQGRDWMRRCALCRRAKRRRRSNFAPLKGGGYARTCRRCRTAISTRALRRQYEREGDRLRARHAARAREARKRPEVKQAERDARRRWRAKVAADPERLRALRETDRIGRRLRRERQGKPLPAPRSAPRHGPFIPLAPLAATLDRTLAAADTFTVARAIGVSPRTVWRWRHEGEVVSIGLVEAALRGLDLTWGEVYPPSEYPQVYALLPESVA